MQDDNKLTIDNIADFIFYDPLYTEKQLYDFIPLLEKIINYAEKVYCPICKDDSIFKINIDNTLKVNINNSLSSMGGIDSGSNVESTSRFIKSILSNLSFTCSKNQSHKINICVHFSDKDTVIKIGQYPAITHLQFRDISKYDKELKRFADEYRTSLRLFSQNIGIGSFVYLRRIFEQVVENVHQELIKETKWDEHKYKKLNRMEDKINMCEEFRSVFPDEIKKYKIRIWKLLSIGIHELEENECMQMYPILKFLMEAILDDIIERKQKALKLKEAVSKLPPR